MKTHHFLMKTHHFPHENSLFSHECSIILPCQTKATKTLPWWGSETFFGLRLMLLGYSDHIRRLPATRQVDLLLPPTRRSPVMMKIHGNFLGGTFPQT